MRTLLLIFIPLLYFGCTAGQGPYETVGFIERLDPRIDELIPPNAELEVIATGFEWSEGPLWIGDAVLFSDIPPNSIYRWSEQDGLMLYLQPSGYTGAEERGGEVGSNGLILDSEGKLVLAQHGDRRVARMIAPLDSPESSFETLAGEYNGMRLNSPNDLVYHSNGSLYFTDPPYGLERNMADSLKETPFQGVYRLGVDGEVTLLDSTLSRPNGIAFSPDEGTLYVANSDPHNPVWVAYSVAEDGLLSDRGEFFDASHLVAEGLPGLPDGLKVDVQGNLFATGPGGVLVFDSEGTHLGTLNSGQATSNCAFGEDGSTLFITADMYLLRIRLNTL